MTWLIKFTLVYVTWVRHYTEYTKATSWPALIRPSCVILYTWSTKQSGIGRQISYLAPKI